MTERLVYYSVSLSVEEPRPDIIEQFAASVQTLRRHNGRVRVALFCHGPLPRQLAEVCSQFRVMVHGQGPYAKRLATLCPAGWPALARYPLLHKFLNFRELSAAGASQVLFCDCDTVFFRDVEELFDSYGGADVVAREEVHSGRSPHGADRAFIDEPLLASLASMDGAAVIAPFNLGVVLFNNRVTRVLTALDWVIVDYAWRFVMWMAMHPASGAAARYGEFAGVQAVRGLASANDVARALPFPSVNRWILDEVAFWLALGHVGGLRTADFDPADVAQNGEFAAAEATAPGWVLCHYYSQNTGRLSAWLRRNRHRFTIDHNEEVSDVR